MAEPWESEETVVPPWESDATVVAPKKAWTKEELNRQLGLTGRYGVGGIMKTFTGLADAIEPYLDLVIPGEMQPISGKVDPLLDKMGFPRPEGRMEEYVGTGSEFLSGASPYLKGAQVLQKAPGVGGEVAKVMTQGPKNQAISSAAGGIGLEAGEELGMPPWMTSLVASMTPGFGKAGLSELTRRVNRGSDPTEIQKNIASMEGAGLTPTVETVAGPGQARASAGVSAVPGGGGPRNRVIESNIDQFEQTVDDLTAGGSRSQQEAGSRIVTGVEDFLERTRLKAEGLYDSALEKIDPNGRVSLGSTQRALNPTGTLAGEAPNLAKTMQSDWIKRMGLALDDDLALAIEKNGGNVDGLPYATVRRLRSEVGRKLDESAFSLTDDASRAELKRVYGALSDDLKAYSSQFGDDASQAASRADKYYKARMQRVEDLESVINKNGGPEKVYKAIVSGTQDGATTLKKLYQSLLPKDKDYLTQTIIRRMGQPTPGTATVDNTFSINKYLTDWNKMSPEAKAVMMGNNRDLIESTDALYHAGSRMKGADQATRNASGTSQRNVNTGYAIAGGGGAMDFLSSGSLGILATMAGISGGANMVSRMMNNPRFVHWLARTTKLPPGSEAAAFKELTEIASESEDANMIEFLDAVRRVAVGEIVPEE